MQAQHGDDGFKIVFICTQAVCPDDAGYRIPACLYYQGINGVDPVPVQQALNACQKDLYSDHLAVQFAD